MRRKVLALVLSFVLLITVSLPSTYATEAVSEPLLGCDAAEHTHSVDCYTISETAACGIEEGFGAHGHDKSCYEEKNLLTCTLIEDETHVHGEGCYVVESLKVCSLEASAGHIHDKSCYPEVLSCTQPEHQHSAECQQVVAPIQPKEPPLPDPTEQPEKTQITEPQLPEAPEQPDLSDHKCTCLSEDGVHSVNCPLYEASVNVRTINEGVVTLVGNIPEDVTLVVEDYSMMRRSALDSDSHTPLSRLNITLYNPDGTEWQPEENQSVSVTLDAAALGLTDGHGYIISHIHNDEVMGETVTNYSVVPTNGKLSFELPGFSYILIFSSTIKIENVKAFYPATTINGNLPGSSNNKIGIIGLYYDQSDNLHLLFGYTDLVTIGSISINGTTRTINSSSSTTVPFQRIIINNESGVKVEELDTKLNNKPLSGYIDVNVGKISVQGDVSIIMSTNSGGFSIPSTIIKVNPRAYGTLTIKKTVAKEYNNDVIPSDDLFNFTVLITGLDIPSNYSYSIGESSLTVSNGGTISLSAGQTAVIQGIPVGATYTVTEVLGALTSDYTFTSVNGGTSSTGTQTSGMLGISGATLSFTNTYKRHLADLTISKSGAQSIDENQAFLFTVTGANTSLTVTVIGNGFVTIKDLPIGNYTITENTSWSWRYSPDTQTKNITITAPGPHQLSFTNSRTKTYWLNGSSSRDNRFN